MSLETNLVEMERARENYWRRHSDISQLKLRWRAMTVRHCFHVLPGESILEVGAGSGLWTEHLSEVLRHQNEITAAVFNADLAEDPRWKSLQNVRSVRVESLNDFPAESFDYVIGTSILCHDEYHRNLMSVYRVLKPGGQLLFFESNFWNPQVFVKSSIRPLGRWLGNAGCQVGLRRYQLMQIASQVGFSHLDVIPYDIIHPSIPYTLVGAVQSVAFVLEHMPVVKELCGTLYIRAQRPGGKSTPRAYNLAEHRQFRHAVSFVVPCHNEETNVGPLVDSLRAYYDSYIHEIIIVNDNSTDRTAEVTRRLAEDEPRIKLINRTPPNGVGRALRDGCAAATGDYVFTMDGDFVHILPEFRDLFDAVARGYDGAVGSRFTQESIMVNYPFFKILCNRGFHLMANALLPFRVRDISNNLKLYRAEIFRKMSIEQVDFAANAEIGLKAVAAGYRICEVPISWINRTIDMGSSSFRIARVAPNYFRALVRVIQSSGKLARHQQQVAGVGTEGGSTGRRADGEAGLRSSETAPCPLCGAESPIYLDGGDRALTVADVGSSRTALSFGRIHRCPVCRFGFRSFRPSDEELTTLYREADDVVYEREGEGRRRTASRHAQLVERYCRPPGRLLDVGCASGTFVSAMAAKGWTVEGVEPSRQHFLHAERALGGRGRLQQCTLQEARFSDAFDVVTLWDVLEHVRNPVEFLDFCKQKLASGGYLFLNVPDLDSLQARLFGRRWPLLLAEHLNYFNVESLQLCARKAGLTWIATGQRPVSFSINYVLYRLSQHAVPLASSSQRLLEKSAMGNLSVPIWMGERYAVLRKDP